MVLGLFREKSLFTFYQIQYIMRPSFEMKAGDKECSLMTSVLMAEKVIKKQ